MSTKRIPGYWSGKACAYSEGTERMAVLAATPNGESARKGYLHYLSFCNNKATFQVGPVMPSDNLKNLKFFDVPPEVADAAIQAAIGVVLLWQQSAAKKN